MALWTQPSQRFFRFDAFQVDLWAGELRKGGAKLKIQEQPLKVLSLLLARAGELVTREELRQGLWSNDTYVDFDRGLNTAVNRLRAVLSDSAEAPRIVQTVGRRGYRFIASLSSEASAGIGGDPESVVTSSNASGDPFESQALTSPEASVPAIVASPAPAWRATGNWNRVALFVTALVITAGAIGYSVHRWRSRSQKLSLERLELTKLTDNGKAGTVAISPDGHFVAYLFRDGENTNIRLRQVKAGGETQVLVNDPLLYRGLTFSPDGNHFYFLRATTKNTLFRDLYEIPILGGPERKITSNVDSAISFSPDGRQFVYERGRSNYVEIRVANADGSGDRLLAGLDGAAGDSQPGAAWSPDGNSIAVPAWMLLRKPGAVLYVISTVNGGIRELFSGSREIGRPRWLLDGKMLVVAVKGQSGRTQLWTISYPAGEARRLTNDLADYDLGIDTTRDGTILSTVQWTTISNLWESPSPEVFTGKQITYGEQRITGIFSLDGRLAMVNRANNELWIMNADGTYQTIAVDAQDMNFTGCGRFIVFESFRSGTSELTRMDQNGTNAMLLATGVTWGPACSNDGKFVYYVEVSQPRWKIRRVPIDGGPGVDIVESPAVQIPGRVAISPDGQLLAFPFEGGAAEPMLKIGVFPIAGGQMVKQFAVSTDMSGVMNVLHWSPDGRSLLYPLVTDQATNLWRQPLAGGPPQQVTRFKSGQILDFDWSVDDKKFLLARGETTGDVVLLSNLR